jgi:hypothetical protein
VKQIVEEHVDGVRSRLWQYLPPTKYIEYNTVYLTYCLQHALARRGFDYDKTAGTKLERNPAPFVFDAALVVKNRKKIKVIDRQDLKYLNRLIAHARENGSSVLLYTVPQYHEKLRYLENHREFLMKTRELSRTYKLPYANYEYDDLATDDALFLDGSHLNARGAVLFSEKLAQDVKKAF